MPKNKALKPCNKILRLTGKATLILGLILLLLIGLVDLSAFILSSLKIYINSSSSMPMGLYKVSAPDNLQKGDSVVVCLPKGIGGEGLKRGYLSPGDCPEGYSYIIKELIAMPGDNVVLTDQAITVNDQNYFAPVHSYDNAHLPVAAIPRGSYKNTTSYWLYGANNQADSWDSRYWGGVSKANILKLAHPVPYLTFK